MQCSSVTKRFTADFDDDLYREFSKVVIDEDTTKAEVVRSLVREWLDER